MKETTEMKETTDYFCKLFNSKEVCTGAMARLTAIGLLPSGVNPEDPRIKQIIIWCKENMDLERRKSGPQKN